MDAGQTFSTKYLFSLYDFFNLHLVVSHQLLKMGKSYLESVPENEMNGLLKTYRQAIKNVPLLKYSWILIATICILALTAYFKLKNADVFFYAFGVILVSFLGFLFSYLLKINDKFIRVLLRILIACIVLTIGAAVLGFGSFIFWKRPEFYRQWFPVQINADTSKKQTTPESKILIEPAEPLFDSNLLDKEVPKSVQPELVNRLVPPPGKSIEIVNDRDTMIDNLPCKYFTVFNNSNGSVIINKCAIDILSYEPFAAIPETGVIRPLTIWDITVPYRTGYFEYKPQNAVLIAKDDAATIGIRFSCKYDNTKVSPNQVGLYTYTVSLLTSNGQNIKSKKYEGFGKH